MAAPVLLFGSLDLSTALKVAKDEGMDPAGSDFLTPEFASSPFADGNALTSLSANNREMVFPLIFTGASKAAMLSTQRDIAAACNAKPALRFTDLGYTDFTEFDVVFARFDIDYNYRRQAKNWLGGWLRVWVKPYGTTGTSRVVGTAVNASGIVHVPVPTVLGDVSPEVTLTVKTGTTPVSGGGRIIGAAVVPSGYRCFYPVGSVLNLAAGAAVISASGAPDGQAIHSTSDISVPRLSYAGIIRLGTSYVGANRILGLLKPTLGGVGYAGRLYDTDNNAPLGPTAVAGHDRMFPHDGFELVDLGVARVPSAMVTKDFRLSLGLGPGRYDATADLNAAMFFSPLGGSLLDAGFVGGFIVLPEDAGYLLSVENALKPAYRAWFGGSGVATMRVASFTDDFGVGIKPIASGYSSEFVPTTLMIGAHVGTVQDFNSGGMLVPLNPGSAIAGQVVGFSPDLGIAQARRMTCVFGFAVASSGAVGLTLDQKVETGSDSLSFKMVGLPSPAISLTAGAQAASLSLQATSILGGLGVFINPLRLEWMVNGSRTWANLIHNPLNSGGGTPTTTRIGVGSNAGYGGAPTSVAVACIGFDHSAVRPCFGNPRLTFAQATTVGVAASVQLGVYYWAIDDLVQPIYTGSDIYTLSDHDRAPALVRNAGSTAIGIDQAAFRGDGLKLTPSIGQTVAVFAIPQDGGSMQDVLDVTVSARERFTFLRP